MRQRGSACLSACPALTRCLSTVGCCEAEPPPAPAPCRRFLLPSTTRGSPSRPQRSRGRPPPGAGPLPQVLAALDDARLAAASATVARPSLDDVSLRHTGHSYSAASSEGASA